MDLSGLIRQTSRLRDPNSPPEGPRTLRILRPQAVRAQKMQKLNISERLDFWPDLKLLFVMVIFPAIGNSIQFWVQDNLLKKTDWHQRDSIVRDSYFKENPERGTASRLLNQRILRNTSFNRMNSGPERL